MSNTLQIQPGYRFILRHDVDRFPDFIARSGISGTVAEVENDGTVIAVMEETIRGAEYYDNKVWWETGFLEDTLPLDSLPTPFDGYEVHGVAEFDGGAGKFCEQVADEEAQFWSLYGHIPGQGLDWIGDFNTRKRAEEIYARITGRWYADARRS